MNITEEWCEPIKSGEETWILFITDYLRASTRIECQVSFDGKKWVNMEPITSPGPEQVPPNCYLRFRHTNPKQGIIELQTNEVPYYDDQLAKEFQEIKQYLLKQSSHETPKQPQSSSTPNLSKGPQLHKESLAD